MEGEQHHACASGKLVTQISIRTRPQRLPISFVILFVAASADEYFCPARSTGDLLEGVTVPVVKLFFVDACAESSKRRECMRELST